MRTTLGVVGLATALLLAASFANVSAQTKQTTPQLACTEIKDEAAWQELERLPMGGRQRCWSNQPWRRDSNEIGLRQTRGASRRNGARSYFNLSS
jgi:hypothetical protein